VGYGPDVDAPDSPEVLLRVQAGLAIVDQVARKFARALGGSLEFDDLVGHGRLGLLQAARRFDSDRGIPFEAYASRRIRGAVLDAVRSMALSRRTYQRLRFLEAAAQQSEGLVEHAFSPKQGAAVPSMAQKHAEAAAAMASAMALGTIPQVATQENGELVGVEHTDPEQLLGKAQLSALVARHIDELSHDQAELIRRHYFEGERFDKIAADMKMSKWWAFRLHSRTIAFLSAQMRGAD
jgi:RNA polymerase sigma factor FliA